MARPPQRPGHVKRKVSARRLVVVLGQPPCFEHRFLIPGFSAVFLPSADLLFRAGTFDNVDVSRAILETCWPAFMDSFTYSMSDKWIVFIPIGEAKDAMLGTHCPLPRTPRSRSTQPHTRTPLRPPVYLEAEGVAESKGAKDGSGGRSNLLVHDRGRAAAMGRRLPWPCQRQGLDGNYALVCGRLSPEESAPVVAGRKGADVNGRAWGGTLHRAQSLDILTALLDRDADPTMVARQGWTMSWT